METEKKDLKTVDAVNNLTTYSDVIYSRIASQKKIARNNVAPDNIKFVTKLIDCVNALDDVNATEVAGYRIDQIVIPEIFTRFVFPIKVACDGAYFAPNLKKIINFDEKFKYDDVRMRGIIDSLSAHFAMSETKYVKLSEVSMIKAPFVEFPSANYQDFCVGDSCYATDALVWPIPLVDDVLTIVGKNRFKDDLKQKRNDYLAHLKWIDKSN